MKLPKPSKITTDQAKSIVKALIYVAVSGALGAVIAKVQNQPEMFGVYAPVINIVLVTVKQLFTNK